MWHSGEGVATGLLYITSHLLLLIIKYEILMSKI